MSIFDHHPKFDEWPAPEHSLRKIIFGHYHKYFMDYDKATTFTERYIEDLKKTLIAKL